MSETVKYTGKIKLIPKLEGEDFQAQCKRILKQTYPDVEIDSDELCSEQLYWHQYNRFINVDTDLYEIIELEERDLEDSYITVVKEDEGLYSFDTIFYNGGASLSEMIETGFNNVDDER